MSKIDEIELGVNGEFVTISLYEPSDFDFTPLRVGTSTGEWGVPYVDTDETAGSNLKLYTETHGWVAIDYSAPDGGGTTIQGLIEGWENGQSDFDKWAWDASGYGSQADFSVTSSAAYEGSYGLRTSLSGESDTGYANGPWFASDDQLPIYPKPGDEIEFWFRQHDAFTYPTAFVFGMQQHGSNTPQHANDNGVFDVNAPGECYQLNMAFGEGRIRTSLVDGGNLTSFMGANLSSSDAVLGSWYRVTIDWRATADDYMSVTLDRETGSGMEQIAFIENSGISHITHHGQGGVGFGSDHTYDFDKLRVTNRT